MNVNLAFLLLLFLTGVWVRQDLRERLDPPEGGGSVVGCCDTKRNR